MKKLLVLSLLAISAVGQAPPDGCVLTIKTSGLAPDGWFITCINNMQHDFQWDGIEHIICAGDSITADYATTGTSGKVIITEYNYNWCLCGTNLTYTSCQVSDFGRRKISAGLTTWNWYTQCGKCDNAPCCGTNYPGPFVQVNTH